MRTRLHDMLDGALALPGDPEHSLDVYHGAALRLDRDRGSH